MKLKMIVVDPQLSRREKRFLAGISIPLVLAVAGVAWAAPLKQWATGDVLSADDLNGNFAELEQRITEAAGGLPPGAVMYFDLPACPAGWSEMPLAQGRYLVGLPAGGTLAAAVGSPLEDEEDRGVPMHAHGITDPGHGHGVSDPGHGHPITDPGHSHGVFSGSGSNPWYQFSSAFASGNTSYSSASATTGISVGGSATGVSINGSGTGISIKNAGTVAGTNAPYVQLLVCKKN